jgi:GNAT superfamily N-acetyltransferase
VTRASVGVRVADEHDLPALTRLRRDWAAERVGVGADEGFDRAFAEWWRAELPRRVFWVAEVGTERAGYTAVGSLNVVEIDGMPRPGATAGRWGYVGNAFVLAGYAEHGVAAALLTAAVRHAEQHRYQRLVLRPAPSGAPFYLRRGFAPAGEGMLMFVPGGAG